MLKTSNFYNFRKFFKKRLNVYVFKCLWTAWQAVCVKKFWLRKGYYFLFRHNYYFFVPTFITKVTEYLCLGVGSFSSDKFRFLTSHFWRIFVTSIESFCCPKLKFERNFHLWSLFVKLWGFKDCHFCFALFTRKRGLFLLRNHSKLVHGKLYAIIDSLVGAKFITLYLIWRVGYVFTNLNFFRKKISFYFITFIFSMLLLLHRP